MPDKDVNCVAIEEDKLFELMGDSILLEYLEAAGVDNWDGYSDARKWAEKDYEKWREEYGKS